jgi:hypothetical protein
VFGESIDDRGEGLAVVAELGGIEHGDVVDIQHQGDEPGHRGG